MRLLLFLILLIGSGGGIYALLSSYNQKISSLRMDLMLTKKQLSTIQNKYKKIQKKSDIVTLNFIDTDEGSGIIPPHTSLYLSPDKNSSILHKIEKEMKVIILDKVSVNNEIWYYSALPIDSNVNCKGWINSLDFTDISPKLMVSSGSVKL